MTSQEIYTLSNETTVSDFNNLFNRLNENEVVSFNSLVRLGDEKEVALWTVIAERYNSVGVSDMYNTAYNL